MPTERPDSYSSCKLCEDLRLNDEAILRSSTMAGAWSWVGDAVLNIFKLLGFGMSK